MDDSDKKVNNENEEIKENIQKWLDEYFKCLSCQSQNNVFEVKEVIGCNCAEGCLVKLAFVVGQCNKCGTGFMGFIEASKGEEEIKHKITEMRKRHANN